MDADVLWDVQLRVEKSPPPYVHSARTCPQNLFKALFLCFILSTKFIDSDTVPGAVIGTNALKVLKFSESGRKGRTME